MVSGAARGVSKHTTHLDARAATLFVLISLSGSRGRPDTAGWNFDRRRLDNSAPPPPESGQRSVRHTGTETDPTAEHTQRSWQVPAHIGSTRLGGAPPNQWSPWKPDVQIVPNNTDSQAANSEMTRDHYTDVKHTGSVKV